MAEGAGTGIELEVITPARRVFSGRVTEATAPGYLGQFGVLEGHVSFVTAIRPGPLTFEADGARHHYILGAGFAEVGDDRLVVLTERCEAAEEIDLAEATEAMHRAERVMFEAEPGDPAYLDAEAELAIQVARVDAASSR